MADFYAPNNNRLPLSHIALDVTAFPTSVPFYSAVLGALGWSKLREAPGLATFGPGYAQFILWERGAGVPHRSGRGGVHVAFEAPSRQAVREWYGAAIAAGGTGDGEPGIRGPKESYYAAYVLDPDGYRIEALYHLTEAELAK